MRFNQIICGDCLNLLPELASNSVDLVVTDPPYIVRYKDRLGRTLENDNNPQGVLPAYAELYRILRPRRYCVTFCGWSAIAAFSQAWSDAGFKTVGHIVWIKNYSSSTNYLHYRHEAAFVLAKGWPDKPAMPIDDVQPWVYSGNRVHPTEKAVSILEPIITAFSEPGDVVLDPFSGSGSTAVAAALNDRDYIGIE